MLKILYREYLEPLVPKDQLPAITIKGMSPTFFIRDQSGRAVKAVDSRSAGRYARMGSNPTSDTNVDCRVKPPSYIL